MQTNACSSLTFQQLVVDIVKKVTELIYCNYSSSFLSFYLGCFLKPGPFPLQHYNNNCRVRDICSCYKGQETACQIYGRCGISMKEILMTSTKVLERGENVCCAYCSNISTAARLFKQRIKIAIRQARS